MAIPVLIIGKSGTGKSTSLRNFNKDDVGIINVLGKPLPFKNDLNIIHIDNYEKVKAIIAKAKTNSIVIDDAGYLLTNYFMRGHNKNKKEIFNFYNDLADEFWKLIMFVSSKIPNDKIVYFLMHEDTNDFGEVKPKTIGKMLDDKVCIEGMFTICLRTSRTNGEYKFLTKTNGMDVCKTPLGMFKEEAVDNDLKLIDDTIREFYGITTQKKEKENK